MTVTEFTHKMRTCFPKAKWWLWGELSVHRTPAHTTTWFGIASLKTQDSERCETDVTYSLSVDWDFFTTGRFRTTYDFTATARSLQALFEQVCEERSAGAQETAQEWDGAVASSGSAHAS